MVKHIVLADHLHMPGDVPTVTRSVQDRSAETDLDGCDQLSNFMRGWFVVLRGAYTTHKYAIPVA